MQSAVIDETIKQQYRILAINSLKEYYQAFEAELTAYTKAGVSTTFYASMESNGPRPTWAAILLGIMDAKKQKDLAEFERTMTARYCLELLRMAAMGNYNLEVIHALFVETQQDPRNVHRGDHVLSQDEFIEWVSFFEETLNYPAHAAVLNILLDYLVVYSDLAKTPDIKDWAKARGITSDLGGDEVMRQILEQDDAAIAQILPSFTRLNEQEKATLRLYYPVMTACVGHLYFLEAGPQMLETIRVALNAIPVEERQIALSLIIGMAQMLDMMGSRGQENIRGSLTFTHNMHVGSGHMLEAMRMLDGASDVRPVLEYYVQRRASKIGYANYKIIYPEEAQSEAFMRLACKLRVFEPEKAVALKNAFDALSSENQALLARELSFSTEHGVDSLKAAPNYEATGFHNISKIAREVTRDYDEEMRLALNYAVCFAKVVEAMQARYPDVCQSPNPVSFGKLAFLAGNFPEIFNPETFSVDGSILADRLESDRDKKDMGGKPFVDLMLPNGYVKPEMRRATSPIAASLGASITGAINSNANAMPVNHHVDDENQKSTASLSVL